MNSKRSIKIIARDYFDYLGRHLPQQCASDEFYFLPRSEAANQHLNAIDDLTPERIQDHVGYVQGLLREISSKQMGDLEGEIDRLLIKQSMKSFLKEFDDVKVWRNDPTLYVKIPLFATDRILSQTEGTPDQLKEHLLALFSQIPSFLSLAGKNLSRIPEISLEVALDMIRDAIHFFQNDIAAFITDKLKEDKELLDKNRVVLKAWEQWRDDLSHHPTKESFVVGEEGLKEIFAINFCYHRSPDEILETARHAYEKNHERIQTLAKKIDSTKTWDLLIYDGIPSINSHEEILELFQRQVQELRLFFYKQEVIPFPTQETLQVLQTPSYLQSLRATASYKAPLTGSIAEPGVFYITPGKEDLGLIASHCAYLSAHETYPGHHILDHIRIHHKNPIRRQLESALFYEGWSCYGEQLLDEMEYIQDLRQQLIGLKRQLWRNLRATLDVELHTGKITSAEAISKIETLGFSSQRAQRQVRRFCLTPAYQSCYFMGMHEIMKLRKRFSSKLTLKTFHDTLLGGGQLPFHFVDMRLEAVNVERRSD